MAKQPSSKIRFRLFSAFVLAFLIVLFSVIFNNYKHGEKATDIPLPYSMGPSGPPESAGPTSYPPAY